MIIMKKRSCEILYKLIEREITPNIKEFSRLFNVTPRSIRADINEINAFLAQMNFPPIKTIERGMILLDRDMDYTPIRLKLKKMGYYFYKMSSKERQLIILFILAKEQKYLTMSELSETLYVSRQTIMSDIADLKQLLYAHSISIDSQVHKGVVIKYNECNLRSLLLKILNEYSSNVRERSIFGNMIFAEISNCYPIDEITRWLQKTEKSMNLDLSDKGFHNLLLYFLVTVNRICKNYTIEGQEIKRVFLNEGAYHLARNLYKSLASEYSLAMNEAEINSLANFIIDKKIFPLSSNINNYPDVNIVLANFLLSVFNALGIRLSSNDSYDLFEFLVFHIRALAERINDKVTTNNPFREQIQDEFVNVYNAVSENISIIEEYLGDKVSQDEIAFITMHICAAIERAQSTKPLLSIVVACPGSMATGQLLAAQIKNHFNFHIKEIIAADRLVENLQLNKHMIDFVISSVDLPECSLPCLVVNPIIKERDFYRIQSLAQEISIKKQANKEKEGNLLSDSEDHARKSSYKNFNQSIINKEFHKKFGFEKQLEKENKPFLFELIKPHLIKTNGKAKCWREAITQAGNILVENKFVESDYINSMISKVEEFGPYCVVVKGVALAHAAANHNVISTGMSLSILPEGVKFNHETNDPVHLLFCFCVNDNRDYLKALTNLIALGKQKDFITRILSAGNDQDVYEIIKRCESSLMKRMPLAC